MKQGILALVMLLLLIVGAIVGYKLLFAEKEAPTVQVTEMIGSAQVRSDGAEGTRDAAVGDQLLPGERVSTELGNEVVLSQRPGDRIVITGGTEVVIKDLGDQRTVFELTYGQVRASIKPYAGRTVEFEAPGSAVQVQTGDGSFTMTHDGWGTFDVVPTGGQVDLVTGDQHQQMLPGSRVVVGPDGKPQVQTDLERSVLLKVQWPDAAPAGEKIEVRGEADVGSTVVVAGQRTRVNSSGQFSAQVTLPTDGVVDVTARTGFGEAQQRSPDLLRVDTPTPQATAPPPKVPAIKAPTIKVHESGEWK